MDPASRRSWPSGWRVHGGCTPTGFVAIGSCLAVLPRQRCTRLPRSVAVGEADETLNGGPPFIDLVCRWRVIQEQLSSRQSFCWSGGRQWRTVRGAGYARTSNYVRRSSIPSRRPCLARASMLACMLVLSTPRSTSSILVQQTHGTVSTMTLPVPRLLRWARCMYGRRGLGVRPVVVGAGYAADGQRSLVLGPGSTVSSLVDARSSAGVCPISRLLRRWWVRRGRSSRLRSLLLRRHVDEDDEDLARVNAGSGSHNLDAPYLARQRCRGTNPRAPMGPADRVPFGSAGARVARRADRGEAHEQFTQVRAARMRKTLLLLCGLY